MFFEQTSQRFHLHRLPTAPTSSPNQNTQISVDPTMSGATGLRNLLDGQQHLCVSTPLSTQRANNSPTTSLGSSQSASNSPPTNLSTNIQQPQIDSTFFSNHLKDLKVIRDILMGDEEFCMKSLSSNITKDPSSINLFKDSLDGVLKYLNNSFFQNRSYSLAIDHLSTLIDVKSTFKDNPCSTTSHDHIFQNNFFLFYKFCVRALFIQHIIENPELHSKTGDELRNNLSIDDLAVAIDFFENRDSHHSNSPNTNNSNFNLFGLCHQIPTPNNPPQLINTDEPTQKRKLSQFISDNEEYSPLLETVDCEESKIKRRKYNIAVLSSFNIDKATTEIRDLFHPCLRNFYDQVNEGMKSYREEMLSEKNLSKTSMDDATLGTELVCKYRAKESYFHFLESVKKNPYNYHAYFQLLEVFRLMDKNIETMKWLRIGIVRCEEELNYLNTLYEIANHPLMNMKSSPSGIELISTFTTLIKKTRAVREVFFGCLHHFTHNPNLNEHFFNAIEKDNQCFYGHYFIGMLTGFNKLTSKNHMAPIHFLDNSLSAIKESHAFGFRGIIPAAAYFDSCDIEMTYGNSMLQPFVYYMIGLLKWRVNDVKSTMQNFNKALECNENLILIYLNRVTLFQQTKYFDKALKDNNILMNIIYKHSPLSEIRSELSMAYLNQALLLLDMKEKNIDLVVESLEKSFETYPMNICALDWLCGIQTNRQSLSIEKYEKYAEQVYEYMERLERDEMIRFLTSASAILESEANTYDWMKENIGRVKLVESGFSNKALSVVATNKAVLAGLNIRTGDLIWRRVFNDIETIDKLYSIGNDKIASLSSSSSKRFVRVWNTLDGALLFDINSLSSSSDILSLGEKLIISTGNTLLLKDIKSGAEKWKVSSSNERNVFAKLVLQEDKTVIVIQTELRSDSNTILKLVVKSLNVDNGQMTEKSTIDLSTSSLTIENFHDSTSDKLIFKTTNKLISFDMKTSESTQEDISLPEKISTSLILDGNTYHAYIEEQSASNIKISVKKSNDIVVQFDASLELKKHGKVQSIFFQLFKNMESNQMIYRFIVVTEDDSLIGFKENQQLWKREESLASVDEIKFVEFPIHHTVKSDNGVASFGNRISTQIVQVTELIQKAIDYVNTVTGKKTNGDNKSEDESLKFVQDRLGFQKLVILKTKTGKILAHHTSDGHLVWSLFVKTELEKLIDTSANLKMNVFITKDQVLKDNVKIRSEATILVSDNKKSVAIVVDALNGHILSITPISYVFNDAILLPTTTEDRVHPLLLVDTELNVHIFPETKEIIQNVKSFPLNIHFHTRDVNQGKLFGYMWNVNQTKLINSWSVSLNSPIVAFSSPQSLLNENIYTGIIVQPSGNVLYKYLNPSMFAVATLEKESAEYPFLRVYVIDGTSGEVLYQILNEDASGPINMVLDENTLVYQYTNAKQMRYELTTVEFFNNGTDFQKKGFLPILMEKLFGSKETGVFSSFGYSKPTARKNTYVLPYGVRSIGVTKTTIGVTNKQFILSLTNDQIYLVDKKLIDARRPRNPTAASDEIAEGLLPYNPYVPFISLNVPTYNKPVSRVEHIQTSPSILESTTLMASSGLDIFFTRLSPSKKFDILNDDFSYAMLIISTSALFISVFIAKHFANKKELQLKWTM